MIYHFTKYSEEEEEEPKPACLLFTYQVNKGDKDTSTWKSKKHTKKIQQQNDNKQTQYHFVPNQQLCQNKTVHYKQTHFLVK